MTAAPLPHPGQCCSVRGRNDSVRLQHCFVEEGWSGVPVFVTATV